MVGKILDQARAVMELLNERDRSRVIRITATVSEEPLPVTASKFGGTPYLPEGVDALTNANGDPLRMIAQINCAELPDNDIYPETGILQFWLDPTDDLYGADYDNPISQDGNRVLYFPDIGTSNPDVGQAQVDQQDSELPIYWPLSPFTVEYALSFEVVQQDEAILSEDFFDEFVNQWNSLYPDHPIASVWDLDDLGEEAVVDQIMDFTDFHKIGGKPIFVQGDPRGFDGNLNNYTIDLLTMISEVFRDPQAEPSSHPHRAEILWGDLGTANWLITPEQLAARDFSQVLFEWACG